METWDKLPLSVMDYLAEREAYSRDSYRPIYSLHKWWARRPGATFRMLGLACLSDDTVEKDTLLRENQSGGFEGEYFKNHIDEFEGKRVLDPFVGGGTTLVELNRLGANVSGYELNPVAWWTAKKSIDEIDPSKFKQGYQQLLNAVRREIGHLYQTYDEPTGSYQEILYAFQTQTIDCLTCGKETDLFAQYVLGKKQKKSPAFVYCPNSDCNDKIIEINRKVGSLNEGEKVTIESGEEVEISEDGNEVCTTCGFEFDPYDGNSGYGKYTCSEGHTNDIKETLKRRDEIPQFRYIAYYYKVNGNKRFKEPDEEDEGKLREATEILSQGDDLLIPDQEIPENEEIRRLLNYNYKNFNELFTDRHLVTFGRLFQRASEIEDKNLREFIITGLSSSLGYNGKLVKSRKTYRSGDVFEKHTYIHRIQPTEGNPLNHEQTSNSVENFFEKVYDAKLYCKKPFEKVKNTRTGELSEHYIRSETVSEKRLESLKCKTSERMEEEDKSIDYVITDPPYFGNVQYSELSDYFYVWLREALKEDYDVFQPAVVPKAREIIANRSAGGKGEEFFIEGLANVFGECHRVLKDDGEMVFTYHHNENEAWAVILEAIIKSGFSITGAYPVQSELPTSSHVSELDNAEYDILIFANKERTEEETTLSELRQNLFFELQDMVAEEQRRHDDLSKADLGVILRGKCMYYYSKHYPNVYSDGEEVGIDEALDTVDSVIEQVLEGSVNLPASIDSLTQAYAAFCQRGRESFDDLNKTLLGKNLNVSDLEDEKLVKGPRDKKEPVPADERIRFIERKLNKNGSDGETLLDIDKVQYLYHLYKTDQNTTEYLKDWKSDDRQELAEFMSEVTGDERYENVMEMSLSQF